VGCHAGRRGALAGGPGLSGSGALAPSAAGLSANEGSGREWVERGRRWAEEGVGRCGREAN